MALKGASESGRLGPWFTAAFDGWCTECSEWLYEGELVRYKDGSVVCEECGNAELSKPEKPPTICPQCFTALSVKEQRAGLTRHEDC